jgi:N-acetylmuramoyl-L-alanine amidase
MSFSDFFSQFSCSGSKKKEDGNIVQSSVEITEEKPIFIDNKAIEKKDGTADNNADEKPIEMKPEEITVLIDNGHGKETKGKRSPVLPDGRQLLEWKYTRDIAEMVQDGLEQKGVNSVRIVDTDEDVPLGKRAETANAYAKKGKCILISIHCNAAGDGTYWANATGWEVWSTESKNNSDKLAQAFIDVYKSIIPDRKLRGHKEKNLTLLYKCNCPCVLTENFFMDNKGDCEYMLSEGGKRDIADLHVEAVMRYLALN